MKLFDRAIDRPLPVFLAAGVIALLGLYSLWRLPVNRAPQIEIPYTLVFATWEGASPADVEIELTEPLEEQLNTLDGLRHMTSMSREGLSVHYLEFVDRTDMTESLRDARDEADLAEVDFPDDADPAVVQELSFDDEPIVFFTLSGSPDLFLLRDLAEDLRPALESVAGVSAVEIFGGHEREVRIEADPVALSHHGLTLEDLATAVRRQSRNIPAGELRTRESQRLIRSTGEFASLQEIRAITVATEAAGAIALRDVATVGLGHERLTSGAWWNGDPSVTLIVRRQPRVNTLETVERLRTRVDELRASLPAGIEISASADQSEDIGQMLSQLGRSALFGLLLVVALLLAVFGWRQALLVSSVLPFALLFTALGLYVSGMGVSNIALFALILVLGLVVDGAIIVGEAIFAEQEAGASPKEAAKIGIGRVGMPVITADFTTVAAFAPMLLMVGVMGQFMSVLPKVVMFALLGSVFVDHLVLPPASARLKRLAGRRRTSRVARAVDEARGVYVRVLDRALSRRKTLLVGAGGAFVAALALFATGVIESIFLPSVDRGRFTLNYELPLGSSLEETSRVGRLIARQVEALPELEHYTLTTGQTGALASGGDDGGRIGPEYGRLTVELVPVADRSRSQSEVVEELQRTTSRYAGVDISLDQPEGGPPTGAALAIRIKGEDLGVLAELSRDVRERLGAIAGTVGIRSDYDPGKPEIRVDVDRPRA
ncbi:MAG: efflux RND transporter permease subunit, partial [Myxococcota bacterium]|nr:efflux RND transporter permease subunit [Myxococcota bacterium]